MSDYLIQFLRKSGFPPGQYMAKYINLMLKQLMVNVNDESVEISIWGGCWGHLGKRNGTSVADLIRAVFGGVHFNNLKIILVNGYKSYKYNDIQNELSQRGYVVVAGVSKSDHAKIFKVSIKNNWVFQMIGSTNFSKQQYVLSDRFKHNALTDQADVAFIKYSKFTSALVFPEMEESENMLMRTWYRNLNNESANDNSTSAWASFNKHAIYLPYTSSNKKSTLDELLMLTNATYIR